MIFQLSIHIDNFLRFRSAIYHMPYVIGDMQICEWRNFVPCLWIVVDCFKLHPNHSMLSAQYTQYHKQWWFILVFFISYTLVYELYSVFYLVIHTFIHSFIHIYMWILWSFEAIYHVSCFIMCCTELNCIVDCCVFTVENEIKSFTSM